MSEVQAQKVQITAFTADRLLRINFCNHAVTDALAKQLGLTLDDESSTRPQAMFGKTWTAKPADP